MAEKVVGAGVVLLCWLLGSFLTLASVFALGDGRGDFYVPVFLAIGVGLVAGGFGLLWKLVRPRPAKRPADGEGVDEAW